MIRSMTGFGLAEAEGTRFQIRVEIKSLNGKFLDLVFRIPRILNEREFELRNLYGKRLSRGTVNFQIALERRGEEVAALQADEMLLRLYFNQLSKVAKDLQADTNGLFNSILGFPDVMRSSEENLRDADWQEILACCEEALVQFEAYRMKEGESLALALDQHNQSIAGVLLPELDAFESDRRNLVRERLNQTVKSLGEEFPVDHNRFEQELIYYLERMDITEEKKRLMAHCEMFSSALREADAGKKLGFISQEMGREINTMGSKANYAPMQKCIIAMKEELEKIKEQSLNIL